VSSLKLKHSENYSQDEFWTSFHQTLINLLICQSKKCAADGCYATDRAVIQANQEEALAVDKELKWRND